MPTFIIHRNGLFFEWSTVIDAPVTCAMTREEYEAHYQNMHGLLGMRELPDRLERAVESGTSSRGRSSVEDMVAGNRAGEDESELSFDAVIEMVIDSRTEFGLPPLAEPVDRNLAGSPLVALSNQAERYAICTWKLIPLTTINATYPDRLPPERRAVLNELTAAGLLAREDDPRGPMTWSPTGAMRTFTESKPLPADLL